MAVTKLGGAGRQHGYVAGTIDKNAVSTGAVDLEGYTIAGLMIPTIDSASVTFRTCNTATGTFVDITSSAGTVHSIDAATGGKVIDADALTFLSAFRYIEIVTTASQTTASVDFTFIVKA